MGLWVLSRPSADVPPARTYGYSLLLALSHSRKSDFILQGNLRSALFKDDWINPHDICMLEPGKVDQLVKYQLNG